MGRKLMGRRYYKKIMIWFYWDEFIREHDFFSHNFTTIFKLDSSEMYYRYIEHNHISKEKLDILISIYGDLTKYIFQNEAQIIRKRMR